MLFEDILIDASVTLGVEAAWRKAAQWLAKPGNQDWLPHLYFNAFEFDLEVFGPFSNNPEDVGLQKGTGYFSSFVEVPETDFPRHANRSFFSM